MNITSTPRTATTTAPAPAAATTAAKAGALATQGDALALSHRPKPPVVQDNKAKFHHMANLFGAGVTAAVAGLLPFSLASMGILGETVAAAVGVPLFLGGAALAVYAYIRSSDMPRK